MKALIAYQCEMRDWPHARSLQAIKSLIEWRGSSVGVEGAETFSICRIIEN